MTKGEKIMKHRKILGLSQEDLANKLNISRQSVSKWELNESDPDLTNLIQLSKVLNVTIDYLLNESMEINVQSNKSDVKIRTIWILAFSLLVFLVLWIVPFAWPRTIGAINFLGLLNIEGNYDGILAYLFSDSIYFILFLITLTCLFFSIIHLFIERK